MIQAGIIGGAGYTAGELIRLLQFHPQVNIDFVYSTSNAGNEIASVHQDLLGSFSMRFSDTINPDVDVVFLCLGHGNSTAFLEEHAFSDKTKVIDLSNDFRLQANDSLGERSFVYGLPALDSENIKKARNIANPGCFATAIELALLPLAQAGELNATVHVNATTGATGAGVSPGSTTHFAWRDNNFSSYKVFSHQHLDEIRERLVSLQPDFSQEILFIPNRGNFSRGIFASVYLETAMSESAAIALFRSFYEEDPFTHVSQTPVHVKQVVNTNHCYLHLMKHGNTLLVTSVIDNLVKGASGQAIENMNLMFGFERTAGLQLKATAF